MYISKRALRKHFDPRVYPRETYLLCNLQWGGSDRCWQHWIRNVKNDDDDYNSDYDYDYDYDYNYDDDYHAEEYFLQEIFEPRNYNICDMTWYLSWSPCDDCCHIIQEFLEEQPNVNIHIRIARLYYPQWGRNRRALRELNSLQGVDIKVMEAKDYTSCWETFIQKGVNYHFSPRSFESAIERNRLMLQDILGEGRL